jgi:hypothetical protein
MPSAVLIMRAVLNAYSLLGEYIMRYKIIALVALFTLPLTVVFATQKRIQRPQRKPQVITQTTPVATPTPLPPQVAELTLEAGLITNSGDVKRILRTEFFLLDAHAGELLKAAHISPADSSHIIEDPDKLVFELSLAYHFSSQSDSAAFMRAAMPVLKPHIVQSVVTDFDGKAQFKPLKPGVYYLWGVAEVGRSWAYWHLRLDLQPQQYTVTLDNKNVSFIW